MPRDRDAETATDIILACPRVKVTARRVWVSLSESWPGRDVFAQVHANPEHVPCWPPPSVVAGQPAPGC